MARLRQQWETFAEDDEALLLRWLYEPGDQRMLETFFDVQNDEGSDCPDLFLRLDRPFKDSRHHGLRLLQDLDLHYATLRESLVEAGGVAPYETPSPEGEDRGHCQVLLTGLASFQLVHQPLFRRLVVVFTPTQVSAREDWADWIRELLEQAKSREEPLAPQVRFVVPEQASLPAEQASLTALAAVAEQHHEVVHTVESALNMSAALEEVSLEAGGLDEPLGAFRHRFVLLGRAVERGKLEEAEQVGAEAMDIAREQGWLAQVFSVQYALAAGAMVDEDHLRSVTHYRAADETAQQLVDQGEAALGQGLRVKARLAWGAVVVAGQAYRRAALHFEEIVPLAEQVPEPMLVVESWRMASYAHDCDGARDLAWDRGLKALAAGRELEPDQRAASTLPFLGGALLRLARRHYPESREDLQEQLDDLLGEGWQGAVADWENASSEVVEGEEGVASDSENGSSEAVEEGEGGAADSQNGSGQTVAEPDLVEGVD
jgi:hypothetical protein